MNSERRGAAEEKRGERREERRVEESRGEKSVERVEESRLLLFKDINLT